MGKMVSSLQESRVGRAGATVAKVVTAPHVWINKGTEAASRRVKRKALIVATAGLLHLGVGLTQLTSIALMAGLVPATYHRFASVEGAAVEAVARGIGNVLGCAVIVLSHGSVPFVRLPGESAAVFVACAAAVPDITSMNSLTSWSIPVSSASGVRTRWSRRLRMIAIRRRWLTRRPAHPITVTLRYRQTCL